MASDGRQGMAQVMAVEGAGHNQAERRHETDLLSRLKRQNVALDHLRRALDGDDCDDADEMARHGFAADLRY